MEIAALIAVIGLVIGSFLNVCIWRLPKGESIVFPASHCPRCRKPLRWYDNIPVVSFLVLRGRCRSCKKKISFRYPLVELLTAALLVALYLRFGVGERFVLYALFTCGLIVATFVDFAINEIPDEISIGGTVAGIIGAAVCPLMMGTSSHLGGALLAALGALVGGGSIYLLGVLGSAAFKKEAMGGGDVKLMAMIGAFLGWKLVLLTFFVAPLFGSVVGIVEKVKEGRETIPYGPYLSLAALIALFFGEQVLHMFFYGLY